MKSEKSSKLIRRERCPECEREGRDTAEDNFGVYDDGHKYCFSCQYYYPREGTVGSEGYTYEYLNWRGITRETFRFYDCTTKIDAEGKPISIGFRYSNNSYKVRLRDSKEFYWTGEHRPGLFGIDKFAAGSHKYVIITEGETDAASFYQCLSVVSKGGAPPCVSVQSAGSAVRDCTADRSWLNSFERVYLAFDNDTRGREATALVARLFDPDKVYDVKFSNRKDANEYLQNGEEDDLLNIWKNAKRYLPDTLVSSLSEFKKILLTEDTKGVPYPFQCLNEMTYGIRLGETVLFLAQEKVGKTELMHFIEHKLLTESKANVGAIYLEEPKKRHLQALAGIELNRPIHLPDSGCTDSQIISAIDRVVEKDDRLFIYSSFGNTDPDILLDTIRYLATSCGCRYIILDHITMGVVGGSRLDDIRRSLDYLITKLEMMVKELEIALIIVSHVNDIGQPRESHYLTKVADITIRVERDLMAEDIMSKSTWKLSVIYNRFSGKTGYAGDAVFDLNTYSFKERNNNEMDTVRLLA